jgi:hypothetical protein
MQSAAPLGADQANVLLLANVLQLLILNSNRGDVSYG